MLWMVVLVCWMVVFAIFSLKKVYIFVFSRFYMDTRRPQDNNTNVDYLHWSVLIIISLVIAHLSISESHGKTILISQLDYRFEIDLNWPLAFLMILWIHFCNKKLDRYVTWISKWGFRLTLQLILGVVVPLILNVLVIKVYFRCANEDFEQSGYMQNEFPVVRWMVLFINVLYIAWFFAINYFRSKKINDELKGYIYSLQDGEDQEKFSLPTIEAKLGNKILQVGLDEIACFEREDSIGYVYLLDGRKFNVDFKLYELNELLEGSPFYQINRSVIISFSIIKGYEKVKNQQALVILKDDIILDVSLLVSRYRYDGFKKTFRHA